MVKDKQFYRQILALSLPAAFQSALSLLVVMADNVMVTRTGAYALSAVAQSNAITTFVTAGLNGLATGAVVLISQYWGKRDMKRIKTICSVAAAACLLFAVLCIIAVRLFPRPLLRLVINAGETQVINLAMQYLPIVAFSYLPYALTAAMVGMLKGVEVVRVTLYAALLSLISNVIFNYILIFGHLGLPAMGVTGAAIATVLARIVECAVVWIYLFRVQHVLPLRRRELLRSQGWAWRDYARYGLPVGAGDAQWALVCLLKSVILGQMGKLLIDAASVTDMMMNLGTMFTFALAGGAGLSARTGVFQYHSGDVPVHRRIHGGAGVPAARAVCVALQPGYRNRRPGAPHDRHLRFHAAWHYLSCLVLPGHQPRRGRQPLCHDGGSHLRLAGGAAAVLSGSVRAGLAARSGVFLHAHRSMLQVDHRFLPPARQ